MNNRFIIPTILLLVFSLAVVGWGELSPELTVPESDIIFSHKLHVGEQEIECEMCHAAVESSHLSSDKNMPTMDECGECHDVEEVDECGICHKNTDDPMEIINPERELIFSHQKHIEAGAKCEACHENVESSVGADPGIMPQKKHCAVCHESGEALGDCDACHSSGITLLSIHPLEWAHQHGDRASAESEWCAGCHTSQSFCLDCHRGDNLLGQIHDLNYIYTHGLDAGSNASDCSRCHDNKSFCVDCHESGNRMPLRHSSLAWGLDHGKYARDDVENCASCHESGDPTCARAGCHSDFDGILGTDARIHSRDAGQLDYKGPWHDDESYFCYQCHVTTESVGGGFCQYCHQ